MAFSKSPLKSKPLRNPGESVDRQIQDVLYDKVLTYYLMAAFLVVLAGLEWWRSYRELPPSPKLFTACAAIAVAIAVWKIRGAFKQLKQLKLGRDGEMAVGQFLERLRESGAQIFHDIPGSNFNLDHVVVHRSGIYVIETKTLSKPARGEAKLVYDGERVTKGGLLPERNAITQVRAARGWLAELIEESTGKKYPIRAVVVYPGWFIESTADARRSDVWVLNPKALPSFISHSAIQLRDDDVKLCSYNLSRYVRTRNE